MTVARDARPCQGDESVWSRVPRDRSSLQASKTPSRESNAARDVLYAGRTLWRYYHVQSGVNPNASHRSQTVNHCISLWGMDKQAGMWYNFSILRDGDEPGRGKGVEKWHMQVLLQNW